MAGKSRELAGTGIVYAAGAAGAAGAGCRRPG
jgi:hypothetical protein